MINISKLNLMNHLLESNSLLYDIDYVKIVKKTKKTKKNIKQTQKKPSIVGFINNNQK